MHHEANHAVEGEFRENDYGISPQPPPEDSEPTSCPHCSESCFPSKSKLDFHIAKAHKEALLTCPTCGFKADKYTGLVKHARTHQEAKRKACHLCGLQFGSRSSLSVHIKSDHCEALDSDRTSAVEHSFEDDNNGEAVAEPEPPPSCDEMDGTDDESASSRNNNDSGSDWSPSDGGEPDSEVEGGDDDERAYKSNKMSSPPCTTASSSSQSHQPAINNTTTGDLPASRRIIKGSFRCDQCPATYRHQSRLSVHSKLHENNGRGVKNCSKCGWLVSTQRMKQHQRRFCSSKRKEVPIPPRRRRKGKGKRARSESENNDFSGSEDCSWSPSDGGEPDSKKEVDEAARGTGNASFDDKCNNNKKSKYNKLRIPFYCDHCHMIFTQEGWLANHVRLYHSTSSPPASCPHCPGSSNFVSKQLLKLHMEAEHSEEIQEPDATGPPPPEPEGSEPKSCPHCPQTFPSKMELDYHIAKAHRDALLTCPSCQYKTQSYAIFVIHLRAHQRRTARWGKPNGAPKPKFPNVVVTKSKNDNKTGGDGGGEDVRSRRITYTYRCLDCPAMYSAKSLLSTHLKLHEDKGAGGVTCSKCHWMIARHRLKLHKSKYCISKRPRRQRQRMQKRNNNDFDDDDKSKSKKLLKHKYTYELRTVTEGIPYYCDHCHMIFTKATWLVQHNHTHHAGAGVASCKLCGSNFVSKQLLQMHTEANHADAGEEEIREKEEGIIPPAPPPPAEDSQPQSCPHCPSTSSTTTFPSKSKLDFHIAKTHKEALLTCPTCGFKAYTYAAFVEHSRTHQEEHEKTKLYSCHLCGLHLGSRGGLTAHMQSNHCEELGLEEIKCPTCGVNFSSQSLLKSHVELVHEKKKEHFCEFCGKAFGRSGDLKQHQLLHTAPRELQYKKGPFPCQYCDSKFNVRQGLYYHLKRDHSDKYRFRCEQCGKGYCSKATLTHHLRDCKGTTAAVVNNVPPNCIASKSSSTA